jgi:hypothetical protein
VVGALSAARELPQLGLIDRARPDDARRAESPGAHQRVAARWLLRDLKEDLEATIEEAALAAPCSSPT